MGAAATAVETNDLDTNGSVLGRGTRVRGRIQGDGDLRIEGGVEGDVSVSGELVVEEGAEVQGNVDAATVTISGALTGDVSSRGGIVVRASAKVAGSLGGPEVSLEEGAEFSGRIEADFDLPAELLGGSSGAR
ncbi:MAG: polymer-forming cytoskeletal protein [Polyangiaceae bacterium]|nr:polymer-forming cytoskeletal protein [Polyangiaceae bacterium]